MRLGAFEADELIGAGAMGQVWRGRHARSALPVAIKLVLPRHVRPELAADAVRREARAVAGLEHPNVVWVYDQGEVAGEAAARLEVPEGTPYLVMELLTGGELGQRHARPDWSTLAADLRAILLALAHCHARGVIHRDLKPGNVLFAAPGDLRPGLRLTDFGISAIGSAATGSYGTPQYCAPEQHGDGAPFGPWTDLYAVGALGWRLATGSAPFTRWRGQGIYLAKADGMLPPFEPITPVPAAFEGWLRACLAGSISGRFQAAPDALAALDALAPALRPAARSRPPPDEIEAADPPTAVGGATRRAAPPPAPLPRGAFFEPPLPPPALRDAGLGLWRWRRPPFQGASAARADLLAALADAVSAGRPRLAWLRGGPGAGRTRTVAAFAEAVAERAGVWVLGGAPGPDPLGALIRGGLGLGPVHTPEVVGERLMHRGLDGRVVRAALDRWAREPGAVLDAAAQLIWALARQRPTIVVLDDSDREPALADLAEALLAGPRVPLLVVRVAGLGARAPEGASATRVDPLLPEPMTRLLGDYLPLDAATTCALVEAAAGRPGRAIALLRRAWDAGRWAAGPDGVHVDLEGPGAAALPELPSGVRAVLERVAARGVRPPIDAALVAWADGDQARAALAHAQGLGLVVLGDGSVDFAPGVRRALLAGAAARGALEGHHRAWVAHLPISVDRAWHRVEAGDVEGGLAELARALDDRGSRLGLAQIVAHAERGIARWTADGRPCAEGTWATLVSWRAVGRLSLGEDLASLQGDIAAAHRAGLRALEARLRLMEAEHLRTDSLENLLEIRDLVAPPLGDPAARAVVERSLRLAAGRAGDWELWQLWLARCRETARLARDPLTGDLLHELEADDAAFHGRWRDAYAHISRCADLHPGYTDTRRALFALGAGRFDEARVHARRGVERSAARQDRRHLPWALMAESLVAVLRGELEEGRQRLADARRSAAEHAGDWAEGVRRHRLPDFALAVAEGSAERAMEALRALEVPHNPSPQHHAVLTWSLARAPDERVAHAVRVCVRRLPGARVTGG